MDSLYYDFVNQMKDALHKEINGMIRYEVYPTVDTVIFKVRFKDFEYAFPINHISPITSTTASQLESLLRSLRENTLRQ